MEKKSMGEFMAALRKASGMTQKELAEKLNVSDKTISRWERDDGAPDISAIPVIAEIFGVTCDELLRGERKTHDAPEESTPKGEKQKKRLIAMSLSKYRTRTIITAALFLGGLIAAMILNNGFLRAQVGFLSGMALLVAGTVCQLIAVNQALFAVADVENAGDYRRSVIRMAEGVFGAGVILLGVLSPLAFVEDAYWGLAAESWLISGVVHGAAAALIAGIGVWLLDGRMLKKGTFTLEEKQAEKYRKNHALQKYCAAALALALIVTFIVHMLSNAKWDSYALADGMQFDDYESFKAFMEMDIPYERYTADTGVEEISAPDGIFYYDNQGNEISEEEFYRRELTLHDRTVVCEYIARNESVASIRYTEKDGSLLPITVVMYDDLAVGGARNRLVNVGFYAAYCVEIALVCAVYFLKREK